jgi:hypothetical protein
MLVVLLANDGLTPEGCARRQQFYNTSTLTLSPQEGNFVPPSFPLLRHGPEAPPRSRRIGNDETRERTVRRLPLATGLRATTTFAIMLGSASFAAADSIQRAGLTTGIPEGYGRTPGFYVATMLDFGVRSTDPGVTTQAVGIPMFFTWSTPWDIGKTHISVKAAPLVGVILDAPGLSSTRPYNPYASVWFSWFLGNGFNLSIGEGVQIGFSNDLTKATGRDFTAFQQNVALTYLKNNWHVTGNAFYTTGRTRETGSQPRTVNIDVTAVKHVYRTDYGAIAYGVWDVNSPSVGYLGGGRKQSEIAVGALWGYLLGNLVQVQGRLTTDVYQKNYGGHDTRLTLMAIFPLWTPAAPRPRNAK